MTDRITLSDVFLFLASIVNSAKIKGVESNTNAKFQSGLAAYKGGDYATDLWEWTPLAEKVHVDGQYNLAVM